MSPSLTLSIVSHGHAALLEHLLTDLDLQDSLNGARVIVTLNLAGEAFDAQRFGRLDLVVIRNAAPRGFGANHNAAFTHCDTPWFAVLNPDLRLPDGDPFQAVIAATDRIANVGAIAPQVVDPTGRPEDAVRANLTPWSLVGRRLFGQRVPVDASAPARRGGPFYWLAGMCLVIDARAFAAVGGFDERYFLYCEDYDLCARLYGAGYALAVEPRARIVHDAQRDSHRSLRHLAWHVGSLLRVWRSPAFWRVVARP